MVRCEFKFALEFLALSLLAAVNLFAVPIEPFYFDGAVDQEATWDDLMKYKLWGTGISGEGVVFSNNKVFINDSNGYSGSATGGLSFTNEAHSLGGPLAFGGGFSTGTGGDSILNGPSHFGGRISLTFNSSALGKVIWNGPICSDVNGFDYFDNVRTSEGRVPEKTCDSEKVPAIDKTLDVPKVNHTGFTYDREVDSYLFKDKTNYIDIPEGEGFYTIHVKGDIRMESYNDFLYIRMPEGRYVRIIIDGKFDISSDLHNILVMTVKGGEWNETDQRWDGGTQETVDNKDYGGTLLFYSPSDINFPSEECHIQGTYISGGTIAFKDHYRFAGQLLAKKVQIHHDFDAGDFRYVQFLAVEDIEFALGERGGHLVLDDLDAGAVTDDLFAVLDGRDAADVETLGRIELEGVAAGGGFGVAEHHANLHAQLVDEQHAGVGLGEDAGKLAERLAHEAGLESDVVVAHFAVDFGLRYESGHGVDDDDVDGAGADERFGNVERLLAGIGLGDEEGFDVDAELAGVDGIEGVFGVDEGRYTAELLGLGNGMQGKGGFTGGFGSVNLDDAATREPADAERHVELDTAGRDNRDVFDGLLPESHDGTFTVVLLDLCDCGFDCLGFVRGKVAGGCCFLCHDF